MQRGFSCSARARRFAYFSASISCVEMESSCRGGCILRLGGRFLPESPLAATGFCSDRREWGLIWLRRRENLRGKQENSGIGAMKGAERRITVKTGNWCRVWSVRTFEVLASPLVTLGGVCVMEWVWVLRFAQDDTSNKIKIKSKTF